MSGHSKWSTIKRKKEKTDNQRAKIFTKIGREIAVAVREGGPDPASNSKLKDIISKAKANNVPNDNIDRIIKKAAGDGNADNYEEIMYEGYGPSGIAVIVETLTDNRNRTAGDMRHYFDKFGGNMGQSGCVSFMFSKQGVIVIEKDDDIDEEKLMEDALEAGAIDFLTDDGVYDIRTEPNDFSAICEDLEKKGYTFLLVSPRLAVADDSNFGDIDQIYEYAEENGADFYCVTASANDEIERWRDLTGAEYHFCNADETTLKTMIRSNPGLMLLKDGTIIGKWSHNALPQTDDLTAPLQQLTIGKTQNDSTTERLLIVLLTFFLPLSALTLADRLWAWSKWIRNKQSNNRIFNLFKTEKKMRKKIVAGNWKMNMNLQDGVALAKEINEALVADKPNCEVIICTPFIHLASVAGVLDSTVVGLGAENCADKAKGAYTGEVSAEMVKSTGAQYVILGHSERRQYYGETAEILKEKVDLALANGLKILFCCGETLEEREAEKQNEVVKAELEGSVFHLDAEAWKNIVIAYEPIWAIGTGKTATSDQAEEMLAYIRSTVAEKYGAEAAEETSILYGGSCKASNAPELFSKPNIDGGLIGGASLKCADFKGIIDAWKK